MHTPGRQPHSNRTLKVTGLMPGCEVLPLLRLAHQGRADDIPQDYRVSVIYLFMSAPLCERLYKRLV